MEEYDTPFSVVDEELKGIHKIDRQLFVRMVMTLNRDPMQSMRIMALWLWLQQIGFPNIIERMLPLTDERLQLVADEAVRCLNILDLFVLPIATNRNIPMTENLMGSPISINLIHRYRSFAIAGIERIINDVFVRVFNDIIEEARARAANQAGPAGNVNGGNVNGGGGSGGAGGSGSGGVGNTTASSSQHPSTGLPPPSRRST